MPGESSYYLAVLLAHTLLLDIFFKWKFAPQNIFFSLKFEKNIYFSLKIKNFQSLY
jgi:hypothetical protein